jgi:predicted amidohydrolase YtcJ
MLTADFLFRGGPLFDAPDFDALAVAAGRILAVGRWYELEALVGANTRVVELGGRPLLPGFVDAHAHLEAYAHSRSQLSLEGVTSMADAVRRAGERAASLPIGSWIVGRGWSPDRLGRWPVKTDLGSVAPRHPVALASHDSHALWVNSLALELAGIDATATDPVGGRILRSEVDREPTGLLLESAQELVQRVIPQVEADERAAALAEVISDANRLGLVGIHDFEGSNALETFRTLHEQDSLNLRVTMGLPQDALAALDWRELFGADDHLRVALVKLYADGALGSRTAFLLQPYETSQTRGLSRLNGDEIATLSRGARARGLGVAVHAIGDAAVRSVLDAFERLRADDAPAASSQLLRLEHAQLVDPSDLPRLAKLDVIASMQPNHCPSDRPMAQAEWGDRCSHAYPWKMLLDSGVTLAFGTDCPVEPLDPFLNLHAAVTRQDIHGQPSGGWYPEQCLTLEQAVRAYTLGAAHAAGEAAERGSLTVGQLADLVVVSEPIFNEPADVLLRTHVDLTMIGGRVVFERG